MKKFSQVLLLLILAAAISSNAPAQTLTGSIRGVVSDEEGNPMPGCTAILNSPVMMAKDFSIVTGSKGGYRFPALKPGTYELKVQMPGFKTVRRPGIIVSMGTTVTINFTLEAAVVEEEVTVIATSPTVDLKSTLVGQSFKVEYLEQLPNARDLWTVIQEAPGMVIDRYNVGGSESGQQSGFTAHGASEYQTTYNIDGVNTTDMAALGASTTYYSYDAFEEIQISMSSHSAEIGPPGVSLNIITKTGSNEFHGDAGFYYSEGEKEILFPWQADNITEDLIDQGVTHGNPLDYYLDYSFNIGGPIIKDKLWFWGLRSLQKIHRFVEGFEWEGKPFPETTDLSNWMAKLDFQITARHKIAGSWIYDLKDKPVRGAGLYYPPEAAFEQYSNKNMFQFHWTSILSDNAFLDLRFGTMFMNFPLAPTDQANPDVWPIREYKTVGPGTAYPDAPYLRGYHRSSYYYRLYDRNRLQWTGFFDYYMDDFLGGSHEWKVGFQISKFFTTNDRYNYGPRLGLRYGEPYNIRTVNTPLQDKANIWNYAFYVQDTYVLWNKLTLNFGLRFETFECYLPEQNNPESTYPMNYLAQVWENTRPGIWDSFKERTFPEQRDIANFKNFSPRIGAIYDVFGDGKLALKASFNRYYWQTGTGIAGFANLNGRAYGIFYWDDLNGDMMWQEGEEDTEPYTWNVYAATRINPDLKNTFTDEITIGVEAEILKDFSLGATFIGRWDGNIIDDIDDSTDYDDWYEREFVDFGLDGIEGTADDSTFIVWDNDTRIQKTWWVTNPELDPLYKWDVKNNKYTGLVLRAHKRFSNRWQLLASLTWSKHEGMLSSLEYASAKFDQPNADYLAYGPTYWDRPIILKISGSYQLPWGINAGASIRYNSGSPWARDHETPVRLNYNNAYTVVPVEARGAQRKDPITLVDLRAEKSFNLPKAGFFPGGKLGFVIDVFNVFNTNTTTNFGYLTADNLNIVTKIIAPRVLRVGARFSF